MTAPIPLMEINAILIEFKSLYSIALDLEMAAEVFRLRNALAARSDQQIEMEKS